MRRMVKPKMIKATFNIPAWKRQHGMTTAQIKRAQTIHNTKGMAAMRKYMETLGKNYPGVY